MSLTALDHVTVRVEDLALCVDWYIRALGLTEIDRSVDRVYLGCGGDDYADLVLIPGGKGIESFAVSVGDTGILDEVTRSLAHANVSVSEVSAKAPGIEQGIEFRLPTGHTAQLVSRKERRGYIHATEWKHDAVHAPVDLDHVTLTTGRVEEAADFVCKHLGFKISDIVHAGEEWKFAFCRVGEWHHDVAFTAISPDTSLHHVGFLVGGVADLAKHADRFARLGYEIEYGIGRHAAGGNLFLYALDPSGNRVELTTEMPRVPDAGAPPRRWSDETWHLNLWGKILPPESFRRGS
ncbi:MAG: catechol 2,3-dioxygenase [Actinomycetota bacterium]|jgi:catechol 2,3-dioxygenase|nr:catechol 2,3-dioxygenase [Actinomycetota bacterium]